jgi:hypothetical protein
MEPDRFKGEATKFPNDTAYLDGRERIRADPSPSVSLSARLRYQVIDKYVNFNSR